VIGFVIARKLTKDFEENKSKAKQFPKYLMMEWWFDQYQRWQKAFEVASGHGAVKFH
jgi:hypothetical protein